MRVDVVTLFPEHFAVLTDTGVSGRAHRLGLWSLHLWNPRRFTHNVHQTVDDRPYGGGPGMVMLPEPLAQCIEAIRNQEAELGITRRPVVLLSPRGATFSQPQAHALAASNGFILVCGRYEGIDQRFINQFVDHEISLGDFVLSGGELAALPVLDACVRLLPGALNDARSAVEDSFSECLDGLLDCEHYTRPVHWRNEEVPEVLRQGDHQKIAQWRRRNSLLATARHRPDLIEEAAAQGRLSPEDRRILEEGSGRL